MKKFDRYKFYQYVDEQGRQVVVAVSRHAGRTVKGYAKCDPGDEFDLELGKKLAAARCNLKVAAKRAKRAASKLTEATAACRAAEAHKRDMNAYLTDSEQALAQAKAELAEIEQSMGE